MSQATHYETAPEDRIPFHHKIIYGLGAFTNNLLASATTQGLCVSDFCQTQIETLRLERAEGDISYALAYTQRERLTARFDSLRINDAGSETWTITNSEGEYAFRDLDAASYRINQQNRKGRRGGNRGGWQGGDGDFEGGGF